MENLITDIILCPDQQVKVRPVSMAQLTLAGTYGNYALLLPSFPRWSTKILTKLLIINNIAQAEKLSLR